MDMDESKQAVNLVSKEGDTYEVPLKVAKMSELVKTMMDGEWFSFLVTFFRTKYMFGSCSDCFIFDNIFNRGWRR